jgi:hypothetical protein
LVSSNVVLRLCDHFIPGNSIPVAPTQQARVVYTSLLSQSLPSCFRIPSDTPIVFFPVDFASEFVIQVPDLKSDSSELCRAVVSCLRYVYWPQITRYSVAVWVYMSSTCSFWWSYRFSLAVRPSALPSHLTGPEHIPHGALCSIRVYALYGRSHRVLGVLIMIGLGASINASVCLFFLRYM